MKIFEEVVFNIIDKACKNANLKSYSNKIKNYLFENRYKYFSLFLTLNTHDAIPQGFVSIGKHPSGAYPIGIYLKYKQSEMVFALSGFHIPEKKARLLTTLYEINKFSIFSNDFYILKYTLAEFTFINKSAGFTYHLEKNSCIESNHTVKEISLDEYNKCINIPQIDLRVIWTIMRDLGKDAYTSDIARIFVCYKGNTPCATALFINPLDTPIWELSKVSYNNSNDITYAKSAISYGARQLFNSNVTDIVDTGITKHEYMDLLESIGFEISSCLYRGDIDSSF